jgi:hypothetical protein
MSIEALLPPYTLAERNRELRMQSRALCWRALRARHRTRQLRTEMRQRVSSLRASWKSRCSDMVLIRSTLLHEK